MYLSEKPRPIDFYKEEGARDMMIEVVSSGGDLPPAPQHHHPPPPPIILGESSGEDPEVEIKAPKKRAETWVQDETRSLIGLRREMDALFNTSKSNKHLWEQISAKMREKGFDRSPTMCTDKWRNLLKEFKKAKHQDRGGSGSAKMSYYKEIDEILRERSKSVQYKSPTPPPPKVDSFMQFADKGIDDTSISFGPVEATGRPTLNLERSLDHDGHPLAITTADAVAASGVPPWNWRETSGNGGETQSCCGRVISVKWCDYTRRIGIDGTPEAIKEAIRAAFRLRTKRTFWLEDEDQIIRSIDREMPIGNYTLHLDEVPIQALKCEFFLLLRQSTSKVNIVAENRHTEGFVDVHVVAAKKGVFGVAIFGVACITSICIGTNGIAIKLCLYDESEHIPVHSEDKVFYTEDEYRDFLTRRGWICLREFDGYRNVDNLDDLRPGAIYRGVSLS